MTLRIGGESADSSFWGPNPFAMVKPAYRQDHPYVLTPAWLAEAGSLVAAGALRVIFDLNLAAHSPSMARAVATAAWRAFPSQSITSFEIGNEPDLYRAGLVGLTQAVRGGRNTWAFDFRVDDYVKLFGDYTHSCSGHFRPPGSPARRGTTARRRGCERSASVLRGDGWRSSLSITTRRSPDAWRRVPGSTRARPDTCRTASPPDLRQASGRRW